MKTIGRIIVKDIKDTTKELQQTIDSLSPQLDLMYLLIDESQIFSFSIPKGVKLIVNDKSLKKADETPNTIISYTGYKLGKFPFYLSFPGASIYPKKTKYYNFNIGYQG